MTLLSSEMLVAAKKIHWQKQHYSRQVKRQQERDHRKIKVIIQSKYSRSNFWDTAA